MSEHRDRTCAEARTALLIVDPVLSSMRTARLSSRLLGATPSLASSASSRAGRLRSRTRRVGPRSPKSPRGGRMTHRAEAPGSRGRSHRLALVGEPLFLQLARVDVEDGHLLTPTVQITSHECHDSALLWWGGWGGVRSAMKVL